MASVLVVDDEKKITLLLQGELADAGHEVTVANDGGEAIRLIRAKSFDVVITDLRLGATDGLTVLRAAKEADANLVVLMMTAYATVSDSAVEAMKEGASDYLEKPAQLREACVHALDRGARVAPPCGRESVDSASASVPGEVGAETKWCGVRGEAMKRQVMALVEKVAPSEATVLLTRRERDGERGRGPRDP